MRIQIFVHNFTSIKNHFFPCDLMLLNLFTMTPIKYDDNCLFPVPTFVTYSLPANELCLKCNEARYVHKDTNCSAMEHFCKCQLLHHFICPEKNNNKTKLSTGNAISSVAHAEIACMYPKFTIREIIFQYILHCCRINCVPLLAETRSSFG